MTKRLVWLESRVDDLDRRLAQLEDRSHRRHPLLRAHALAAARAAAGWTMSQAAEACGVSLSAWSRWESGSRSCSGASADRVCEGFAAAGAAPPAAVG